MKKMIILAGFFLVTWNRYQIKAHREEIGDNCTTCYVMLIPEVEYFTVEVATHTAKFKTKHDAELFTGYESPARFSDDYNPPLTEWHEGLIEKGSFNVKTEELK